MNWKNIGICTDAGGCRKNLVSFQIFRAGTLDRVCLLLYNKKVRGHGGIGRRAGFRCQWATV